MKTLLGLLSAVLSLQYVTSQISMVESGPGIVRPSETLDMTCKVTGASLTDSTNMYCVVWIRQPAGKGLEWLGMICYNNDIYYAQSLQGRLTLSRDTNKGEIYFKLTGVKPEESGKYYCARRNLVVGWQYYFDVWGNGQYVAVSSVTQQTPSLFPLISCGKPQETTTTIGCLAKDFFPETINFSWADKSNSSYTKGLKTYNPILQSSGVYITSSQVQVPTTNWVNHDVYYCTAKHAEISKTVKLGNSEPEKTEPEPTQPVVTMHAPIKEDLSKYDNGTIVCLVSEFYPGEINITWLKNHKRTVLNTMTENATNANGYFTLSSYITVSKKEWDEDTVLSCVVEHSSTNFNDIRNVSKSRTCEQATHEEIQITAIPPSFESIYLNKASLTCVISNMNTADGLDVSWYDLQTENKLHTTLQNPVYQDGSFTAKATTNVCAEDWLKKTFECRVRHPELTSPMKVFLAKENGQELLTPTIMLYPPHQEELNKKETASVTCIVKGFAPEDAFVKWFVDDEVREEYVVTTKPMVDAYSTGKKTYILYSTLTLKNTEEWTSGKSISCMVGHESLPLYTTQKIIDKTTAHTFYIDEEDDFDNLWTTASTFVVLFLLSLFYSATVTLFKVK